MANKNRIGLGKNGGKGFKNILPGQDSRTHSNSARGIKQPQCVKGIIKCLRNSRPLDSTIIDVQIAYGDDQGLKVRNLEYLSPEITSIKDAQEVVMVVDSYNAFRGKKVADALGRLNPKMVQSVRFAREGSPALYIKFPLFQTSEEDRKKAVKMVKQAFEVAGVSPDEFHLVDYSRDVVGDVSEVDSFTGEIIGVRLWWD